MAAGNAHQPTSVCRKTTQKALEVVEIGSIQLAVGSQTYVNVFISRCYVKTELFVFLSIIIDNIAALGTSVLNLKPNMKVH